MTTTQGGIRAPRMRGARAVYTTRHGGTGAAPYHTLNLARHVGDRERTVRANRDLASGWAGAPLVFVDQVHSARVHVLPAQGEPPVVTADALVTDRDDVALAIMVADCVPVLLSDPDAGVIGAAHAGRRGLLDGVLQATVAAMESLGAMAAAITAAIGPSICGGCYEVPEHMREDAAHALPSTRATTSWGTPALDLRAGAMEALTAAGLDHDRIDADFPCTLESEEFFSHRRDAPTGRFAGIIRRT